VELEWPKAGAVIANPGGLAQSTLEEDNSQGDVRIDMAIDGGLADEVAHLGRGDGRGAQVGCCG
jgi:hypothetical protein